MIQNIPLEKVLFLDIETVPQFGNWRDLDETEQYLWDKKTKFQRKEEFTAEEYYTERGGIMAEFGKIICISVGILEKNGKLKIKSFYGDDEKKLLEEFGVIFNSPKLREVILCAHNGKEFDFPWIARRFLINGMQPPLPFQMFGKKPWEIPHLDTMELWKFGDYKSFISLDLPLSTPWIVWTLALYGMAGVCWIPVVWLQLRMTAMAQAAHASGQELPALYWRYARWWERLGYPAFLWPCWLSST
jgi:hypothetical protein